MAALYEKEGEKVLDFLWKSQLTHNFLHLMNRGKAIFSFKPRNIWETIFNRFTRPAFVALFRSDNRKSFGRVIRHSLPSQAFSRSILFHFIVPLRRENECVQYFHFKLNSTRWVIFPPRFFIARNRKIVSNYFEITRSYAWSRSFNSERGTTRKL